MHFCFYHKYYSLNNNSVAMKEIFNRYYFIIIAFVFALLESLVSNFLPEKLAQLIQFQTMLNVTNKLNQSYQIIFSYRNN
jgi:hypothetical protein